MRDSTVNTRVGKVIYVHRGNCFDVLFDLGFRISFRQTVWLDGLDLPEIRTVDEKDRQIAQAAKDCAMKFLLNRRARITTIKDGPRYLAQILLWESTKFKQSLTETESGPMVDVLKYMKLMAVNDYRLDAVDLVTIDAY